MELNWPSGLEVISIFLKKSSFQNKTTSLSSKKKNEFFTYFEGPEGVQKVITLYNINQGNYTELVNQKKKIQNFFLSPLCQMMPGCQTSNSASSSKFHHLALLALLVALVSQSSNFHHWPLLALLVALVSQS